MIYEIKAPCFVNACIDLPKSKSISARALIMNALCDKPTRILNLAQCDDTDAMVNALSALLQGNHVSTIDIGAAGTAMRFLTAYLATQSGEWILTGTERMRNRPVGLLVDALRSIGADIEYVENDGFPPLHIKGKTLTGGEISLDGSVSSQYISALLMIAPTMTKGLRLNL
ncbi:MAG: 3-phosphoshikimate 1-carboxyvinyltransferase, partial [Tannerella sp.]|nr:3-phosphoshikimate 1-carboxyvinyltransferase [Tannerella sp.]